MSISLSEGQEITLKNRYGKKLKNIRVKIGWTIPYNLNGMWFSDFFENNALECNAYMLMCQDDVTYEEDIISYCNPEHESKSVRYLCKCLKENGSVTEIMSINLENVPEEYDGIVFMADVSDTKFSKQDFGIIKNAYVKIIDEENNQTVCHYNLLKKYDGMMSILLGAVFRNGRDWEFCAIGEGRKETILNQVMRRTDNVETA